MAIGSYHRNNENLRSDHVAVFVSDLDVSFLHWRGMGKTSSCKELKQSCESHFKDYLKIDFDRGRASDRRAEEERKE
jgi:hypothetical protein